MASVRQFNTTMLDLLRDLNTALPDHPELSMALTLSTSFFQMQPNSAIPLQHFWKASKPYQQDIMDHRPDAIIGALESLVPKPEIVREVWNALTPENQRVVFEYVQVLYETAEELHGEEVQTRGEATDSMDALYKVYNNMWKEFLGHIRRTSDRMVETYERLDQLVTSQGETSRVVHGLVSPSLQSLFPKGKTVSESFIMEKMMPPGDTRADVEKDRDCFGGERFKISKDLTFNDLLDAIEASPDNEQLRFYWHYIKLMTFTLTSCPPEMLAMMGDLSASLMQGMTPVH